MPIIEPIRQNHEVRQEEIQSRLDTGVTILGIHVCDEHQVMSNKCGCFNIDDWCQKCGNRKTTSMDGKHCRLCNW